MTNIITEQQERNKNLLEEIEILKKQLENKEEKIQNAINHIKENESPEIAGTLMTLEQHFLPKNINELTLENFVKGCTE
jgi:hypothetical protein